MSGRREKRSKLSRLLVVLALLLFIAGVGVFSYPYILQWTYNSQAKHDYNEFIARAEEMKLSPSPGQAEQAAGNEYTELYQQMVEYNERLYEEHQSGLTDPWAYEQSIFNLTEYGFEENVIGYIEIPKIDVKLPIYLGASEANMRKGSAHLGQTSLPIGGDNTNCVICGHRSYYAAVMFDNIPKLVVGDEVIVTNLWETMTYRVSDTTIILANEIDKLKIQDGKDMLTLFTCYYQGGRQDRFVVYCERVLDE